MIKDIQELNLPSYATLSSATVTLNDMGDRTISAQVKIDGYIVPDFSYDWEVEFKGERYIQPLRQPQASKGNESMCSTIDLVFYHKTIWQLKRYYFVEMTSTESGTTIADQYIAPLGLNLSDFCVAFQKVLDHYFDGEITIDLNPNLDYTKGVQFMSISYSYIWDVLQKVYEVYGVRWHIEGNTIKVGYPSPILSHTFQYGYEGGLLQVERQVQDANIRNSLLGRGGEQNLPAYYFKEAPEGSLFASDPDAIPELANIYFSNLRGKTFRDYVKGWKAKHYGGTPMSEPTEAYAKGYADTKFSPIEHVENKESIKKYGLLQGALDNNEDIYPSIQGAPHGEDVVVYVEPVTSDDVEQSVGKTEKIALDGISQFKNIERADEGTVFNCVLNSEVFEVPDGHYALNIANSATYTINNLGIVVYETNVPHVEVSESVFNADTGQEVSKDDLVGGRYTVRTYFKLTIPVSPYWDENSSSNPLQFMWHIATIGVMTNMELVRLQDGSTDKWLPTFNIWVKNIWNSTRNSGESDEVYAERIWRPILGDRQGNEAKICFSSGWLSGHEDYEFTIVDFAYDNSHEYDGSQSEWRLTLAKSDAELDATGKYIPSASTNGQAYAGDTFFFIGIDMPYQYVLWAEERLDNYKTSALDEVSEIQPKWVVQFDKLRLHEEEDNLAEQITVGGAINLADVRFIDAPALQLYLQSVTYTWNEQTALYPDIEVVLADTIVPVQSPVAQLQGSIDAINSQLYNIGNVAQTVRKIGDSLYLRKDGVEDTSKSPTKFVGNVSGHNFRMGKVGGADWGIYRDEHGNAIAEFDKIIARKDLEVNNLVINQVSYVGGMQITSAASLTITRVIESDEGYQCFFDQKGGSVANLFAVNDIAYSQRFDQENNATKYYKRVVTEVGLDYITLSKTNVDGDGEPMANDVVIHYGNTTDTNRQYVIIKDIIGGGYERMLSGLNSVSSTGVEYYFAGRTNGSTPRWFVGDKSQQYIEYKDGHLRIIADVTLGENSVLPDSLNVDYLKQAFPRGSVLDVNGVTLSALIGVKDEDGKIVAGLYGGASDELNSKGYADDIHGAMLLFGGIDGADKPTTYKTAIFGDGYIESEYFATARTGARVEMFDNQVKIFGSDGSTHILMGWSAETGNPELQYVDANGARPWLITSQGISNAVTLNTEQKILAVKDFDKGLKIGGLPAYKSQDDTIYLDCNLVVRGGVTAFGTNEIITPSIFEALPIDGVTLKRTENGVLYVASGGSGGSGGGGISIEDLESYLTTNGYLTGITGKMVTDALGYTPLSTTGTASSAYLLKAIIGSSLVANTWNSSDGLSVSGWNTDGGWNTKYGTSLNISGFNTWRHRLGFNTNGVIEHWAAINTTTMSKVGDIAYVADIPTKLSQLTDDVFSGKVLALEIAKIGYGKANSFPLELFSTNSYTGIAFTCSDGTAHLRFMGGSKWGVTSANWAAAYDLLHSGNYSDYALPKDGTAVSANRLLTLDGKGMVYQTASILYVGDNSYLSTPTHILGKSIRLRYGASAATGLEITEAGNVAIGNTTASEKLHVHGNILASGGITCRDNFRTNDNYYGFSVKSQGSEDNWYGVKTYMQFDEGATMGVCRIGTAFRHQGLAIGFSTGNDYNYNIPNEYNYTDVFLFDKNGDFRANGALRLGQNNRTCIMENPFAAYGMTLADGNNNNPLVTVSYFNDRAYVFNYKNSNENSGIVFYDDGRAEVHVAENFRIKSKGAALSGIDIGSSDTDIWQISHRGSFANNELHFYHNANGTWSNSVLSLISDGSVIVGNNLLAKGGITATNSSDERLKRNLRKFNASKVLMSLGGVYEYEYIDSEVQKNHIYEGTHYGLIYQHVKGTKLDVMCHKREDGMGALNYLHPKFISLIAGATMENISEVETLKREVRHLKAKVKQLENRA